MDMTASWAGDDPKDNQFTLSGVCPHSGCRRASVFMMVGGRPFVDPYSTVRVGQNVDRYIVWALMQCQACKDFICGGVYKYTNNRESTDYFRHYPLGMPTAEVATEIPVHIAADFREALQCRWLSCYKATVTMCRRALQVACIDLQAKRRKKLEDQIDDLAKKGKITEPLRQQAHEVRLGGNEGAHPSKDGLDNVSQEDADDVIDFTRDFFHHVYVMPRKREKRKTERDAKKAVKPLSQPPTP